MQCPDNIDTKNSLEKPQNDSSHHDNRDVGQYKEENASNHNSIFVLRLYRIFSSSKYWCLQLRKYE